MLINICKILTNVLLPNRCAKCQECSQVSSSRCIPLQSRSNKMVLRISDCSPSWCFSIRRSGPISETFSWDVSFGTSFEKIEQLRGKMLEFLKAERRDYSTSFDVNIQGNCPSLFSCKRNLKRESMKSWRDPSCYHPDFEGQAKLSLTADIKYKSNCWVIWLPSKITQINLTPHYPAQTGQNGALKSQRRNVSVMVQWFWA